MTPFITSAATSHNGRDLTRQPDGSTEIRCPARRGDIIAAGRCVEAQLGAHGAAPCFCPAAFGALRAQEEAVEGKGAKRLGERASNFPEEDRLHLAKLRSQLMGLKARASGFARQPEEKQFAGPALTALNEVRRAQRAARPLQRPLVLPDAEPAADVVDEIAPVVPVRVEVPERPEVIAVAHVAPDAVKDPATKAALEDIAAAGARALKAQTQEEDEMKSKAHDLTNDQIREAIEKHGSIYKAAAALGVGELGLREVAKERGIVVQTRRGQAPVLAPADGEKKAAPAAPAKPAPKAPAAKPKPPAPATIDKAIEKVSVDLHEMLADLDRLKVLTAEVSKLKPASLHWFTSWLAARPL